MGVYHGFGERQNIEFLLPFGIFALTSHNNIYVITHSICIVYKIEKSASHTTFRILNSSNWTGAKMVNHWRKVQMEQTNFVTEASIRLSQPPLWSLLKILASSSTRRGFRSVFVPSGRTCLLVALNLLMENAYKIFPTSNWSLHYTSFRFPLRRPWRCTDSMDFLFSRRKTVLWIVRENL